MSVLEIISQCVGSRKTADTIIKELAGRGYAITLYRRPVVAGCHSGSTALDEQIAAANLAFAALPLDQQAAMRAAQRESWGRGEMELSRLERAEITVPDVNSLPSEDYFSAGDLP